MTFTVPNASEIKLLQILVNNVSQEPLALTLFTNNVFPAVTDTLANYTVASGFGYANVTLSNNWATSTDAGGNATASHTSVTFTFTGAIGEVYGYNIVRDTSKELYLAERFSSTANITLSGDQVIVTPTIRLHGE